MPAPLVAGALALAAEFAPSLIRLFAGDKAGDVAEKVATVAKAVTGEDETDKAAAVLRANPELLLQFKSRMADVEVELEKAFLADRQDARAMSIERAKIGAESAKADARRKNAMIIGDVVGLVVCLGVLVYVPDLPGEVRGIISTIAGFFGLGLRDAHQFEFGSSRGSLEKNNLLAVSK